MKKAYNKDIRRSIWRGRKRFLSILMIMALGVTVLTGIYAACQDMYYSADRFYDEQGLFDIRIVSTLGLTEEDVEALKQVAGIEKAEGSYSETVDTQVNGIKYTAAVIKLSQDGMNRPYLLEGRLPSASGEIAVTRKYLNATGKQLGDLLMIEERMDEETPDEEITNEEPPDEQADSTAAKDGDDTEIEWDTAVEVEEEVETPSFINAEYIITAVVIDPMDISTGATFRSAATNADYTFFVSPMDVESDVFTGVYLTLNGMKELDCYSADYKHGVREVIDQIEAKIKAQREAERYNSIRDEAIGKIEDAEATMYEKFAEADEKFQDAWDEVEDGQQELADGEAKLSREEKDAWSKIADARAEIADGRAELTDAQKELEDGEKELLDARFELAYNEQQLQAGRFQLEEQRKKAEEEFANTEAEFAAAEAELQSAEALLNQKQAGLNQSKTQLEGDLSALQTASGVTWSTSVATAWDDLVAAAASSAGAQMANNPDAQPDPAILAAETATAAAALGGSLGVQNIQDYIAAAIGLGVVSAGQSMLDAGRGEVSAGWAKLNEGKQIYQEAKAEALKQLADAEWAINDGERQIAEGWVKLNDAAEELEKGKKELADGWRELLEGEAELNQEEAKAKKEIADAWQEIREGKHELIDGENELLEKEAEYHEKKQEAAEKIADAYEKLEELDMAQWYVQDRSSIDSYSSLKSDMSSIESVGGVFPIVFLVVAILISLTTMTRMIEEERGLTGTYKAMGFGNGAIYRKYLTYAMLACILGGVLGDLGGFILLPQFLLMVLRSLYVLPDISMRFDLIYGIGGVLLFMAGIVGATVMVCRSELKQMPAALMRPKAPRSGSRVFLEWIPFIWKRLKFLNKVTVRNLFRYKKRFFMTVLGIMGCTALVLAGFSIKDSVTSMIPKQYDEIYQYDLMAVADAEDNQDLLQLADGESMITDYVNLRIDSVKVFNSEGDSETVQLLVVPDGQQLDGFIRIRDTEGSTTTPDASGILITRNAADLLKLEAGSEVVIQNLDLEQGGLKVTAVVQNYLGNIIYMEKSLYESVFSDYQANGILAHLSPACTAPISYAEHLLENDILLTTISNEGVKEKFTSHFTLINSVVYVFIILAAGLAFVVLFTLSNTNISERSRELATTKVLGFYDREVHAYVNKETLILTGIGIAVGLPVGRFLSGLLTMALKMPSMYFETYVAPVSFVYAVIISFSFALIVNQITNRSLNKINMVEALKSVE